MFLWPLCQGGLYVVVWAPLSGGDLDTKRLDIYAERPQNLADRCKPKTRRRQEENGIRAGQTVPAVKFSKSGHLTLDSVTVDT